MKTTLDILDAVIDRLGQQGCLSLSPMSGMCMYRAPQKDGRVLKCAVGVLIPDDVYDQEMENQNAESMLANFAGHGFSPKQAELLSYLQTLHDGPSDNEHDTGEDYVSIMVAMRRLRADFVAGHAEKFGAPTDVYAGSWL